MKGNVARDSGYCVAVGLGGAAEDGRLSREPDAVEATGALESFYTGAIGTLSHLVVENRNSV